VIAVLASALALSVASREALYRSVGRSWWSYRSPYSLLRWVGDTPQVELGGRWYELRAIDDLHVGYVLGFCKQNAGLRWRKRFSEDLLATLNVMGDWAVSEVDLELRDLESGATVRRAGVPLTTAARRSVWVDRHAWPFEAHRAIDPQARVTFEGRTFELVSIGELELAELTAADRARCAFDPYDVYCENVGRSPPAELDVTLRDPQSGELRVLERVRRGVRATSS
jgi:hypothetical protein